MKNLLFGCIVVLMTAVMGYAQSPSNMELFNKMVDSSAAFIIKHNSLQNKVITIEKNLPPQLNVLANQAAAAFIKNGVKIVDTAGSLKLGYALSEVKVKYDNMFRKGFLGTYCVERFCSLKGNYIQYSAVPVTGNFEYSSRDTVEYDSIKKAECASFPFTQGEIPAEPFFASLLEPVVAVGSAAVVIYLFFSVRSK